MNERVKKILKYVVSVLLAAVLLYFSFKEVKWNDFVTGLQHCNWWYVVLSMICGASAFLFRSFRWKKILKPIDPAVKWTTAFNAINIGNVANFIFPYLGEVVRCGIVNKRSARIGDSEKRVASFDKVVGTAIIERFWDVASFAMIIAILLAFTWQRFGLFFKNHVWTPVTSSLRGWILCAILAAIAAGLCVCVIRMRERSRLCARIYAFAENMIVGIRTSFHIRGKFIFAIQTVIIWTFYWLMIVFIAKALPEYGGLTLIDTLFISMIGSFASIIPVPGGMGAYHYIVALSLSSLYGFSWESAIVFATLAHESQTITMIITGGISYIWESIKK